MYESGSFESPPVAEGVEYGVYLYCVFPEMGRLDPGSRGRENEGAEEPEIGLVDSDGPLAAAAVRGGPDANLFGRVDRHLDRLARLAQRGPMVPVEPGVIFASVGRLRRFLERRRRDLICEGERLRGSREFGLRLKWRTEDVHEYLQSESPTLREQSRGAEAGDSPCDPGTIAGVSRAFARVLARKRRAHREAVERELGDTCLEIESQSCEHQRVLAHLRCRVEHDETTSFERRIYELAEGFESGVVFELSQPFPPVSFVEDSIAAALPRGS